MIVVDGRMFERLHLGMVERTVYIADSIREAPKTKVDCERAKMKWDDKTKKCS